MHFEEPFVIFHIFSTPPPPEQGSADFFTFIFIVPQFDLKEFRRKTIWTDGTDRGEGRGIVYRDKNCCFYFFFYLCKHYKSGVLGLEGVNI